MYAKAKHICTAFFLHSPTTGKTLVTSIRKRMRSTALFMAAAPVLVSGTFCQNSSIGSDIVRPNVATGHSYIVHLAETVNPGTGTLNVTIPLPVAPSRGISLPLSVLYNSGQTSRIASFSASKGQIVAQYGWELSAPTLQFNKWNIGYPPYGNLTCTYFAGFIFKDPTGQQHSLPLAGASAVQGGNCTNFTQKSPPGPGTYSGNPSSLTVNFEISLSGTDGEYRAQIQNNCNGNDTTASCSEPQVKVTGLDGTTYYFNRLIGGVFDTLIPNGDNGTESYGAVATTLPYSVVDRNGNTLVYSTAGGPGSYSASAKDTISRQYLSMTSSPSQIAVSGLAYGVSSGTVQVSYVAPSNPVFQPQNYHCDIDFQASITKSVINTLTLPNGLSYTFHYDNPYGLLSEIQYPNGAWVKYAWQMPANTYTDATYIDAESNSSGGAPYKDGCSFRYGNPQIFSRSVGQGSDSSKPELDQVFTYTTNWNANNAAIWDSKQTIVKTTDHIRNVSSTKTYSYIGYAVGTAINANTLVAPQVPLESLVTTADWNGTVISSVSTDWQSPVGASTVTTSLDGSVVSSVSHTWLAPGIETGDIEYQPDGKTVLRQHQYSYQPGNGGATGFICSGKTVAPNGNVLEEVDTYFDGSTTLCSTSNASVQSVSSLDPATRTALSSGAVRANPTMVVHVNSGATSPSTTYTYDETGQVISVTDPCGNASCSGMQGSNHTTNFSYSDKYSGGNPQYNTNAYLTSVTKPLVGTSTATYVLASGQLATASDVNGGLSSYSYQDSMRRLTEIDAPAVSAGQPKETVTYSDSTTGSSTTVTVQQSAGVSVATGSSFDGFGRLLRTSTLAATVDRTYNGDGSLASVSNPYSSGSATASTTFDSDALGRQSKVHLPGGSNAQSWSYSGLVTTFTDELSFSWVRTKDVLGRLIAVQEPSQPKTTYSYDLLNNLTNIQQPGLNNRAFSYDALSRLSQGYNPETGWICYGMISGGVQPNGSNCPANGYDANGNLLAKTDARGVTTSYAYDALNRLLSKTYSDNTRGQFFGYDGNYDNGLGALAAPYNQNAIGRMTQSSDDTNIASSYAYDAMGRLIQKADCYPSNCSYNDVQKAEYDLAGNMTAFTYPDGRKVQNGYDAVGRFQSVAYQSWNGNGHSYTYATVPSGSFDAAGHVTGMIYGNALGLAASYDNRQRVQYLAYGSTQQLLWGRQYAWTSNSNLNYTTDMLNGTQRQFGYDSLNRLTAAQDIVGSTSGANTSNYSTGNGGTTNGSSSGSTTPAASPTWTDPDDSNILYNPDVPGSQGWVMNQVTINTGFPAPDGSVSAYRVTSTGGDSFIQAGAPAQNLLDNETMIGSVWLRSNSGPRTINLYMVENSGSGYDVPAAKTVNLTSTWQQYNLSGMYHYGQTLILFSIGAGGSFTSGSVDMWGAKLEDQGQTGRTVTNFLPYSQRLTTASWQRTAVTVTDNSGTAPDGTNTAATLTAYPGNSDAALTAVMPNPALSGATVTGSVWLRAPAGTVNLYLILLNSGGNGFTNIAPQATVTVTSAWTRYQITGVNQSALSTLFFAIGGSGSFTNGQQVQAWGAQIELATTAGPYVPTGSVAASIGTNLTNLLPNSSQLSPPTWGFAASSGQVNSVPAPDGTTTGLTLTANAPDSILISDVQNPALYNAATITGSLFLRAPSGSGSIHVYIGAQVVGEPIITYLDSGALPLTGDWKRFAFTRTVPNKLSRLFLQIGGANSFQNGQQVSVWGPQMELSSTMGSYVPTNGMPVVTGQEASNLLQSSQQLGGPGWAIANAATTPNAATAPNGTQTATLVTGYNGTGDAFAVNYVPNPSLYDGQTVTGSVYLRVPAGQPNLNVRLYVINVSDDAGWHADTTLNTITSAWQRFSITSVLKNGVTTLNLQVGGGGSFTSNQQLQVWGTQMVVGSTPGVYEPTSSTTTSPSTGQPATLVANGLNDAYGYDSFGNITRYNGSTPGYDANNRMVGWPYNLAGNLLTNGLVPLTWDAESRITSAGGGSYLYDAMGQRVESNGSGVVDTVYFGGRPVARLQNGQWTDLIYGPTGLVAEVAGQENADPQYRLVDHLGTLVGTTDGSQLLKNPMDYNPFGAIRSGSTNDPYLFTGKERDTESGLDYFGARYYGSNMGRFMSPDWSSKPEAVPYADLGNPQSLNLYSYAGNNPLSRADADGHFWQELGNFFEYGHYVNNAGLENALQKDAQRYLAEMAKQGVTLNGKSAGQMFSGLTNKQIVDGYGYVEQQLQVQKMANQNKADMADIISALSLVPGGANRPSTGRTDPANLNEQLAMEQAKSNPGAGTEIPLKGGMKDPNYPGSDGWVKMTQNINGTEVHYVRNVNTGEVADFKFK